MNKLEKLAKDCGYPSVDAFLQDSMVDSVAMGICRTPECDYTTEVEPDQSRGWCEECSKGTVVSGLVLAGII